MKKLCLLTISLCLLGLITPSGALAAKADGKKGKLLAKYDKNGDGTIDGEEKDAIRKDYAANPEGELKEYDTNNDGKLDDAEIAAIKPGSGTKKKEKTKDIIAKYDKNSNGIIDGTEMDVLRKDYAADLDGDLKQFDTNHDGKLDDTEIAAIKLGESKKKMATEKPKTEEKPAAK